MYSESMLVHVITSPDGKLETKRKTFIDSIDTLHGKTVPWLRLLVPGFPPRRPKFEPGSENVGFVVDKVALGQVFSQYFGFPYQFSFHRPLHIHHLSSWVDTIGQLVADVPSGLSHPTLRNEKTKHYIK
jgi:hypothetical protein